MLAQERHLLVGVVLPAMVNRILQSRVGAAATHVYKNFTPAFFRKALSKAGNALLFVLENPALGTICLIVTRILRMICCLAAFGVDKEDWLRLKESLWGTIASQRNPNHADARGNGRAGGFGACPDPSRHSIVYAIAEFTAGLFRVIPSLGAKMVRTNIVWGEVKRSLVTALCKRAPPFKPPSSSSGVHGWSWRGWISVCSGFCDGKHVRVPPSPRVGPHS